jgi:hypothetical protein
MLSMAPAAAQPERGFLLSEAEWGAIVGAVLAWRSLGEEMAETFLQYGGKKDRAYEGTISMLKTADQILRMLGVSEDAVAKARTH